MEKVIIDLGATNLRVAHYHNDCLVKEFKTATAVGKEALTTQLFTVIDALSIRPDALLLAVCGPVINNYIHALPLINVFDYPLGDLLIARYKCHVVILNDANAAVLHEARNGIGRGVSSVLYLTLSSGIGAALTINNKLYQGHAGYALEVGKIICRNGTYESLCGGQALARELGDVGAFFAQPEIEKNPRYIQWLDDLTNLFKTLFTAFDPDLIILGGGLMKAEAVFLPPLMARLGTFGARIKTSPYAQDLPTWGLLALTPEEITLGLDAERQKD